MAEADFQCAVAAYRTKKEAPPIGIGPLAEKLWYDIRSGYYDFRSGKPPTLR